MARPGKIALSLTLCWSMQIYFTFSAFGQVPSRVAEERKPESLSQLPLEVRRDLAKRQCLIPRYSEEAGLKDGGYARSHFRSGTSVDYAIVCHIPRGKAQNVLVYSNSKGVWKGEVIQRTSFDPSPARNDCEATVAIAAPKYILEHAQAYAPAEVKALPRLDHNGVEVWVCDKASVVYYFHQGRWLQLAGAD